MVKVSNTNFFKQKVETGTAKEHRATEQVYDSANKEQIESDKLEKKPAVKVNLASNLADKLKLTTDFLMAAGQQQLARQISRIVADATRDKFTIAVVGEFSRGKSAMINRMMGRNFLPEGNLPTTAMLTRIRYAQREFIVHINAQGEKQPARDLSENSWKGLVADCNPHSEADGVVAVGLNNQWLHDNDIEIVDTPGAGDLNESRARQIGDMLMRCDGAVITVNATQLLSETERLFIQQRVIGRKTPFVMMVINKLDLVKLEERNGIIAYAIQKLKNWGIDIPVFIGNDVELKDDTYTNITGIEHVRETLTQWANNKSRRELVEKWVAARVIEVLDIANGILTEQKALLDKNEEQRREAIDKKMLALKQLSLEWGNLEIELMKRANSCYTEFLDNIDEFTSDIVERLQYEVAHANNMQKWWSEDYPYRLKKELANMSVGLNNVVMQRARQDATWFNAMLDKRFKEAVAIGCLNVADKKEMEKYHSDVTIEIEDANSKINKMRMGTAAVSIAGAILLTASGLGILSLVATMGVGTGAAIFTNNIFKKKIEEQREILKKAIAKDVPEVISRATADSERRVKAIYDDMRLEAKKKQALWTSTQQQLIEQSMAPNDPESKNHLENNITKCDELKNIFASI